MFDHKTDYMPDIIKATEDIDVQVVFNNAGYIVTAFFDHTTVDAQLANMECNATSCVKITHHFLQKLLKKNLKGCFVFTSSVSGYIPNPFAVMYGATKGFVSQFAASLAIEVASQGIDVLAVHPSPVASNFFDKVCTYAQNVCISVCVCMYVCACGFWCICVYRNVCCMMLAVEKFCSAMSFCSELLLAST